MIDSNTNTWKPMDGPCKIWNRCSNDIFSFTIADQNSCFAFPKSCNPSHSKTTALCVGLLWYGCYDSQFKLHTWNILCNRCMLKVLPVLYFSSRVYTLNLVNPYPIIRKVMSKYLAF